MRNGELLMLLVGTFLTWEFKTVFRSVLSHVLRSTRTVLGLVGGTKLSKR